MDTAFHRAEEVMHIVQYDHFHWMKSNQSWI